MFKCFVGQDLTLWETFLFAWQLPVVYCNFSLSVDLPCLMLARHSAAWMQEKKLEAWKAKLTDLKPSFHKFPQVTGKQKMNYKWNETADVSNAPAPRHSASRNPHPIFIFNGGKMTVLKNKRIDTAAVTTASLRVSLLCFVFFLNADTKSISSTKGASAAAEVRREVDRRSSMKYAGAFMLLFFFWGK